MTRFARAKGSKASNERVFEEATSWQEMKSQLLEKKNEIEEEQKRKEAEGKRNANYQSFLKDKEEKEASQVKWADFPIHDKVSNKSKNILKKNERKVHNVSLISENGKDSGVETDFKPEERNDIKKIKRANVSKLKQNRSKGSDDEAPAEASSKVEVLAPKIKRTKPKQKKLKIVLHEEAKTENSGVKNNEISKNNEKDNSAVSKKKKQKVVDKKDENRETVEQKPLEKKEQKPKVIDLDSLTEGEKKKLLKKQEKRRKQMEKKKLKKQQNEELAENQGHGKYENNAASNAPVKTKKFNTFDKKSGGKFEKNGNFKSKVAQGPAKKVKSKDGDFKRRKDFKPNRMIINGNEVDVEYYDGFPIKKEDADNLKQLRKQMVLRGLPGSEIKRTMQLERRKAEKALAREKKKVCFNCRKSGHNLSECQELSNQELVDTAGTGICFKCGSTEHTSFKCKVVQGQSFNFASCFICKERGHISRQCPDNARGLYPKGGSCKICGDVTHLKKDCPQFQVQQEKEQQKFQVETFGSGNLEDLDGGSNVRTVEPVVKKNKIIKF